MNKQIHTTVILTGPCLEDSFIGYCDKEKGLFQKIRRASLRRWLAAKDINTKRNGHRKTSGRNSSLLRGTARESTESKYIEKISTAGAQ